MDIIAGSWIIEGDNLVSKSLINEFYVLSDLGDSPNVNYSISNLNSLTRVYVFIDRDVLLGDTLAFFELDVKNNVINTVKLHKRFILSDERTVLKSVAFIFSKTDYVITTNQSLEGTFWVIGTPDIPATLFIDGQEITFCLFQNIGSGALNPLYAGIYTEQKDFQIGFISSIEKIEQIDIASYGNYMTLMAKILLYKPQDIVMPFWMNFIAIKLPLIGLGWILGEMIRGN